MNPPALNTRGTPRRNRIYPELAGLPTRERKLARQRIRRAEWKAQGLTTRGTRRQVMGRGKLIGLTGHARRNAWLALQREARYALGLTARGTPRKYFTKPRSYVLP